MLGMYVVAHGWVKADPKMGKFGFAALLYALCAAGDTVASNRHGYLP